MGMQRDWLWGIGLTRGFKRSRQRCMWPVITPLPPLSSAPSDPPILLAAIATAAIATVKDKLLLFAMARGRYRIRPSRPRPSRPRPSGALTYRHIRAQNTGTILYTCQVFTANSIALINRIIWHDHFRNIAPIWCGICQSSVFLHFPLPRRPASSLSSPSSRQALGSTTMQRSRGYRLTPTLID